MDQYFKNITVANLRDICRRNFRITGTEYSSRIRIYSALERQPEHIFKKVVEEATSLSGSGRVKYTRGKKNSSEAPTTDTPERAAKRRRVETKESIHHNLTASPSLTPHAGAIIGNVNEEEDSNRAAASQTVPALNQGTGSCGEEFMRAPDQDTVNRLIGEFIDATGNDALLHIPCCSCARSLPREIITTIMLDGLPNKYLLIPRTSHPAHKTVDGMLLCTEAIFPDRSRAYICVDCLSHLKKVELPPLSLANDMWIGDIPYQLSNLTLPERLMIAKGFPSAYIIKLFPKQRGATHWENSQFHSGLKGNVSTYKMNPAQLADVVLDNEYPHPARILSATIGVTFVGPRGIRESSMPSALRVRRWRVRDALIWLKRNNPLYADINISQERLSELPENGIPDELLSVVKYSNDIIALYREQDGYVPEYEDCETAEDGSADREETISEDGTDDIIEEGVIRHSNLTHELLSLTAMQELSHEEKTDPYTFSCQALGVVDIDGDDITHETLMSHALNNNGTGTIRRPSEDFVIRRGSAFVNEYARADPVTGERNDGGPSNPNHLLGAFPTLFPYGKGGFETKRQIDIPYETHVRWSMRYHDKRFRKDYHFPFQVFGVCQKRDICRSTVLQIKKSHFQRDMELISTIKPDDLLKASIEEGRRVRFSNSAVRTLRRNLAAVRTKVKGSDESRTAVRSKIWGMNLACNPPSLWVTINPSDTQDPIAQVLAGADINLDAFCSLLGPTATQRATNVATDPFASASFFHFIIKTVIEVLFGIKKTHTGRLSRKQGIFGYVRGYVGTVETQGRGTLHLHMLIWLMGAPSSGDMQQLLSQDLFRERVANYINAVIKADVDGLPTEGILQIPPEPSVTYSRPADPRKLSEDEIASINRTLARTLQLHTCSVRTCLRAINGTLVCKRRAPFPTSANGWINEVGEWGPKRTSPFMNAWNPAVLSVVRANNDIKIITNGRLTAKLTFYITSYATKKQTRSSNVSALLAKDLAFHRKLERKTGDVRLINKRLIQRCANSLTRNREFSAPEVMTYLMGWKDTYESHHFATIYLDALVYSLKEEFPVLRGGRTDLSFGKNANDNMMTLTFSGGSANLKDQLRDYQCRGVGLSSMSLLDFILNTYEGEILKEPTTGDKRSRDGLKAPGRPRSERHEYLPSANKGKLCRVIRAEGHETMPRICGSWFARSDRDSEVELHNATMLALLVPWRKLRDINCGGVSFGGCYKHMMDNASDRTRTFISNAQYYHECLDGAREKDTGERSGIEDSELAREYAMLGVQDFVETEEYQVTEDDIEIARVMRTKARERLYGEAAIDAAIEHKIFTEDLTVRGDTPLPAVASEEDMRKIEGWEKRLSEYNKALANQEAGFDDNEAAMALTVAGGTAIPPRTLILEPDIEEREQHQNGTYASSQNSRPKLAMLNTDQRRAHDIVEDRLKHHMRGTAEQLRMLVLGCGGTGKSLLIGAITETFQFYGQERILAKCATTGIAAAGIGAQTLHSWAALPVSRSKEDTWIDKGSKESIRRRMKNIEGKVFLIEDEVSMEDKALSYDASLAVSKVKGEEGWAQSAYEPYGGMHVIKFGDFHQFPPVKNAKGALYVESEKDGRKAQAAQLGRNIFLQFDKVVILREQIRVTDEIWTGILDRIRIGECDEQDVREIRSLVLGNEECISPDFDKEPWSEAILVTPRHAVREMWNDYSLKKHCSSTGNIMYTVSAEDFSRDTPGELDLKARLAVAKMKDKETGNLQDQLKLAVGMKAMVKTNYALEADIANGTRGRIESIILDPRETTVEPDDRGDVKLRYPPALILFRPDAPTTIAFEGLPRGLIPITPSTATFTTKPGATRYKITRRQYALTPGYAFTDYKSQGQTIEYVIIDIGKPPSGSLSAFGIYVALSRSRGRSTIRLLRDFDETIFQNHPSEDLRKDMVRLERLNEETKEEWDKGRNP